MANNGFFNAEEDFSMSGITADYDLAKITYGQQEETGGANLFMKTSFDGLHIEHDSATGTATYPEIWGNDTTHINPKTGVGYNFGDLPGIANPPSFSTMLWDSTMKSSSWDDYVHIKIIDTTMPDNSQGKALKIGVIKSDDRPLTARVQFHMKGSGSATNYDAVDLWKTEPDEWFKEFYFTYQIKMVIDSTSSSAYAMCMELKDWLYPSGGHSRWHIGMGGPGTSSHRWYLYILDKQSGLDPLVSSPNSLNKDYSLPCPRSEWVKLEVYARTSWASQGDGFIRVAIDGVESDALQWTQGTTMKEGCPPSSMGIFKHYGYKGYHLITDFEYWDKPPSTSVLSQPV